MAVTYILRPGYYSRHHWITDNYSIWQLSSLHRRLQYSHLSATNLKWCYCSTVLLQCDDCLLIPKCPPLVIHTFISLGQRLQTTEKLNSDWQSIRTNYLAAYLDISTYHTCLLIYLLNYISESYHTSS